MILSGGTMGKSLIIMVSSNLGSNRTLSSFFTGFIMYAFWSRNQIKVASGYLVMACRMAIILAHDVG
jgi:hypothetical protein